MAVRLLDLYCGAGGCAVGYAAAGFDVVGVDVNPQKHYPFGFHQADAIEFLLEYGGEFDCIHASPPCQRYSVSTPERTRMDHPDLIGPTRDALISIGKPYVIENVPGAPLLNPFLLCGSMFGLRGTDYHLRRHRYFEAPWWRWLVPSCFHWPGPAVSIVGNGAPTGFIHRYGRAVPIAEKRQLMGISWMNRDELAEAIPPAYTEFIGCHLMEHIRGGVG